MIEVSEELKKLYRTDHFPARDTQLDKQLKIYFPELDKTIINENIYTESMKLTESICSESDLTLGGCEATEFSITIAGVGDEIADKRMIVTQIVDGRFEMPLGTYRVKSVKKKDDLNFKEILAYDAIIDTDVDVSDWYNSLTWPQTVKTLRESLLNYLKIEYEEQELTNDSLAISKTITPTQLLGRTVLKRLCEINAGFGHIRRNGKFKVIQLSGLGLYPSETLYPAEDLFPSESGEYVSSGYIKTEYEEYIVEPITAITIREDDEDIGATEGTLENPYVINDNFLLYGKSSIELHSIAANILLQVKNKFYRPHNTSMIGLPYMEVGDVITIITNKDAIETFIFQRELSGIQALRDEIKATGNQKRSHSVSPNDEIQQLKSKTLKIQKEVDQLSINMFDMEQGLSAQIALTASQLQTQITDNYNNTNSQISQMANTISLKVSKGDVSSQLSVESDQVTIAGNRLVVDSTNFKLDANGNATFSGKITGGTMNINNNFTVSSTGDFYAKTASFGGVNYKVTVDSDGIYIKNTSNGSTVSRLYTNGLETGLIFCDGITINGSTAISEANKSYYTFPPESHYQDSTTINPITTAAGNVGLNRLNVASVNWCNETFQKISSSDFRLKYDFKSLDELPDELYLELKPWQYKFKVDSYGKGIFFGLLAQEVESTFERYGLNALDYNLIEITETRDWTDEGQFVLDGKVHRINYENLHAWNMKMIQKIYRKVFETE